MSGLITGASGLYGGTVGLLGGTGLSTPPGLLGDPAFTPASLFYGDTQGAFFDFSDMTTMFRDVAGTIPVTSVEQTVARALDKSGRGNHATQSTAAARPTLSARYNLLLATAALATQTVTTVATTYRISFRGSGSITLSGTATGTYTAGSSTVTCTAGTLTLTVSGSVLDADFRAANDGFGIPAYQQVNTATDYDTYNFPLYLRFDGGDALVTGNVDFSVSDEASVFCGARKLNNALATIVDTNYATGSGKFELRVGGTTTATKFSSASRGSAAASNALIAITTANYDLQQTAVLTMLSKISTDQNIIRVNGGQQGSVTADQGTGNYSNTPIALGRRVVSGQILTGRIYNAVVLSRLATSSEIASTEAWVNSKARVY